MTTDALIERILNRLDEVSAGLSALTTSSGNIVERLDRLNGSVARHQSELNDQKLWQVKQEALREQMDKAMAKLETQSKIDGQTMVKICLICSATVLAIAKATGPLADQILTMLK